MINNPNRYKRIPKVPARIETKLNELYALILELTNKMPAEQVYELKDMLDQIQTMHIYFTEILKVDAIQQKTYGTQLTINY